MTTTETETESRIETLDRRLEELRSEAAAVQHSRASTSKAFARAIADGAAAREQDRLRATLEKLTTRGAGIEEATALLEAERAELEPQADAERLAVLREVTERSGSTYAHAYDEAETELRALAAAWMERAETVARLHHAALVARRAALKAEGADRARVYYAMPDDVRPGPSPQGSAADTGFWRMVRTLIAYGSQR